jgi:hypothetical protein
MNQNILLIGLLIGAMFFLRRPNARQQQLLQPSDLGIFGYTGGEGTGYGIDIWGDEG